MNKRFSSLSITKIFIFLSLGIVSAFFVYYQLIFYPSAEIKKTENVDDRDTDEVFRSAIIDIQKRWEGGDLEGSYAQNEWRCPEIPNNLSVDSAHFECNPDYFDCYYRGKIDPKFPQKLEVIFEKLQGDKIYRVIGKSQFSPSPLKNEAIHVKIVIKDMPEKRWSLLLENTCRMVYLPERLYRYQFPKKINPDKSYLWDNFNRSIFIDRFLVTNRDIKDWKNSMELKNLYDSSPEKLIEPATGLTIKEQKDYCAWRGARRLDVPLYHAAIFIPLDINHPMGVGSRLSETSWAFEKKETHFMKNAESLTINDCELAYVKECKRFPFKYSSTQSSSWSGISQIMGGFGEQFRNPHHAEFMFKTSTYSKKLKDESHVLGNVDQVKTKAGFRCYQEIEYE